MKFDITQRAPALEATIAKTTNPRHLAILLNFRRHAILEVCGLYEGILTPDMIVPHPIYRFHTPKGTRVIEGMDAVRAEYKSYVDQNTSVIYHTEEHIAVNDDGLYAEYISHRFFPGQVLVAQGEAVDDPNATYLASLTQAMFWPYDNEARLVEERVYRGNDRTLRRCEPDEVITMQECRDKLLPTLNGPIPSYTRA
jgi:hypothetical protein